MVVQLTKNEPNQRFRSFLFKSLLNARKIDEALAQALDLINLISGMEGNFMTLLVFFQLQAQV